MWNSRTRTADCFVRVGVELIAHRWDAVVLTALRTSGPLRRIDLRTAIGGISDKALHESLGRLRARGLVEMDRPGVYLLTVMGESLATGPVLALARWAEAHQDAWG